MVIDPRKVFYQKDFFDPMNASVGQIGSEMDWVNLHFRFIGSIDLGRILYAPIWLENGVPVTACFSITGRKNLVQGPEWIMEKAATMWGPRDS